MAVITTKKVLMASAVAGLLTMGTSGAALADSHGGAGDGGKCYGVNKCKGTGACGGKGYSCAGNNECKGHGWLKIDKETCLKIQGGRLTPEEEKS
jgi:uncharacterized membrane protein